MNNTNIKTAITTVTKDKIAKRSRFAKKAILFLIVAMCVMTVTAMTAFAAGGSVDTTDFINTTVTVLQSLISLIGAGLAIWGIVNLIEGYSGDNAAAKSQGIKQLMAGLALVLVGLFVVPILGTMMTNAMAT